MKPTRSSANFLVLLFLFCRVTELLSNPIESNFPQPKHGLHFTKPILVWDEALPLGNGILGALVWGEGRPLRISLDRTDLWDLTPVPEFQSEEYSFDLMRQWHEQGRHEDLVRVYEKPYHRPAPTKIPAGRIEITFPPSTEFQDTSLSLAEATVFTRFRNGSVARVFLHAEIPVGLIQIQSSSLDGIIPKLIAPPFGGKVVNEARGGIAAGDLAQLGYETPVQTSGDDFQAFTQEGALGAHFAVYFAWRQTQEGQWLGAWSVASSSEGPDPFERAKNRVEKTLHNGFDVASKSHQAWWQRYWGQSSIRVPNPILERQWFLEQYKFGAASRRGAPPISLQGPWTADNGRLPPWKGDYHHDLNTQLSYWPCYSGNHLEPGLGYLDWLWKTRSNCVAWTKRFFNKPGLNVPMTSDLNNSQIGGWRQYTHSATTAAWLAHHFYLHWKYSADREFLRDRAWPYLREASVFIEAITEQKGPDGRRTLSLSSSPEIHDNRPQAWFKDMTNYDLALMRWLLGATAELAAELGKTDSAEHWQRVLGEMPDFSLGDDGRLLVAQGEPLRESHRHFSHLMALHPLGLIDIADGSAARRTVEASLRDLDRLGTSAWCGYSFSWLANIASRAYDGAKAEEALEIFATAFTLPNSFHCNGDQSGKGYSNFRYRPFTLEGNFAAAAGQQEMLLQSHRDRIEVFPAIPEAWKDAAFTTLRAQGAFLISAERRGGVTRQVEIESETDGTCRLLSPFSGKELTLNLKAGEKITLTQDPLRSVRDDRTELATSPPRRGEGVGSGSVTSANIGNIKERLSCSSLCQAKQSTEQMLRTVSGLGFKWVDLSCLNWARHVSVPELMVNFDKETTRVETLLAKHGLRVSNLTFDAVESQPYDQYKKQFKAVVKLATRLNTRLINLMAPSTGADRPDQVRKLRELQAIAAQAEVILTLETHKGQITERPADALWICQQVPGLGLTLDPSHYYAGLHQGGGFDELLPFVKGTGLRAGGMTWEEIQLPWGQGPIDFVDIIRKLETGRYHGFYVVEYIEGHNELDAVEESKRFLEWGQNVVVP